MSGNREKIVAEIMANDLSAAKPGGAYLMRTVMLAIAFVSLAEACAADSLGRGIGSQTCAQFAEQYRGSPQTADLAYMSWAQGFTTGFNFSLAGSKNVFRDLDTKSFETQATYLRQYCNDHPLATFFQAVVDLFSTLPFKKMPQSN